MSHAPGHAVLRLGRPPDPRRALYKGDLKRFVEDLHGYITAVARELEQHSDVNDRPAENPYSTSNVIADRTFDANSTSTAELADILGTVIADLQDKGVLS